MENQSNMNRIAYVSALYISREKGKPRVQIEEGLFKKDHGLEGDVRSGAGGRQVVMLSRSVRMGVDNDSRRGLCFSRFKETLQIDGSVSETLFPGVKFKVGEAVLEITGKGKRCFPECEIVQSGAQCGLKSGVLFARVLQTGTVHRDDAVQILK